MAPTPTPIHVEHNNKLPDNYGQPGYVAEYRGYALLLTELIMMAITLLIVGLRLFTRVHILGAMHSDDWWILLATAILIGLTAVHGVGGFSPPFWRCWVRGADANSAAGVKYGIGKHTYDILPADSNVALTVSLSCCVSRSPAGLTCCCVPRIPAPRRRNARQPLPRSIGSRGTGR